MRIKHIAMFAAAAIVSLSSVAGPQGAGKEVVTVHGSTATQVRMPAFLFDRMQGEYSMEDGRVLNVTGTHDGHARSLYADLGNGPIEIVHVGAKRFVAVGQDLSLRFQGDKIPDTVFVRDGGAREVASTQR